MASGKFDLPDDLISSTPQGNEKEKLTVGLLEEMKDPAPSDSNIPLSPQWLYAKANEARPDVRTPRSVSLGNAHESSQKEGDKKDRRKVASTLVPLEMHMNQVSMREDMEKRLQPSLPTGRVKRIVKLDKEINKLTSEALLLISASAELFIQFLANRSAEVAGEKKRKMVKLEHLRVAVKRHHPTNDFLLDSLPQPEPDAYRPAQAQVRSRIANSDKPAAPSVRRIDSFFRKSEIGTLNAAHEKENEESEQRE